MSDRYRTDDHEQVSKFLELRTAPLSGQLRQCMVCCITHSPLQSFVSVEFCGWRYQPSTIYEHSVILSEEPPLSVCHQSSLYLESCIVQELALHRAPGYQRRRSAETFLF